MNTRLICVEAEKPYFVPQWLGDNYWHEFTRLEETAKVVQFATRSEAEAFLRSDPGRFGADCYYSSYSILADVVEGTKPLRRL